jgi:hypothetical protein
MIDNNGIIEIDDGQIDKVYCLNREGDVGVVDPVMNEGNPLDDNLFIINKY